ncbi:MAG: hypothetical protein RLZZ337_501 [Bacteroidota bacterium]|jgi:murein tripeptide amidase MpaA
MNRTFVIAFILIFGFVFLIGCKPKHWVGDGKMAEVSTVSVPISVQEKGIFSVGNGVFISNDFDGARMSKVERIADTIRVTVSPENVPINESQWYAFKLYSDTPATMTLQLKYADGYRHRYYPKVSSNGVDFKPIDKEKYHLGSIDNVNNPWNQPNDVTLDLEISSDTLWVAAQEVVTQESVLDWMNELMQANEMEQIEIGTSEQQRPIYALEIGNKNATKSIVVLCRQHPPEVTGYKAMQAFVEEINTNFDLANEFRKIFKLVVIPLANPDGVAAGHWRHTSGGVDMNRDWGAMNQKETQVITNYAQSLVSENKKIVAMLDFHSTWEDIFYTLDPSFKGNAPGLIPALITNMKQQIPNYQPNVQARPKDEVRINSMTYFFFTQQAESLVFEIGDNTPPAEIKIKGQVAAQEMMKLLLNQFK